LKKIQIFITLFLLSISIYAQVNLVPNSGFETASPCPNYPGQIDRATGWNNVNLVYNNFSVGTPDLFHACGTTSAGYSAQPPATFAGTCNPHLGNGFAATVLYNVPYPGYREYFSTQLTCPMVAGNTYTVSWWLTNGTGVKSPYTIRNIGAHFSTAPLTQTGWNIINVVPQCEITGYSGSNAWVQYSFTIVATANWQYITLGTFRTDALNAPVNSYAVPPGPSSSYANYFWDDISVIGNSSIGSTISTQSVTCNSSNNGSATITPTSVGSYTYNWQPGNFNTPSVTNLTTGIYTVTISNSCGSDTKTVSINKQPSPTITVNSATACLNSNINITATTSGGTPGYTYSWSQGVSTSSIVNINATPSLISCTVTDSQGCKANASGSITISSTANSNFQFALNACKGVLTTTNTSTGASQYLWYFGDGSTSVLTSPSYTYSLPGTYTISLVANPFSPCKDSTSQTVTVSNPTQSIYSLTNTPCGFSVQLNNTSIGATTYSWNFGDGNTSNLANPGSHVYSTAGIYTISLITNPGSPCADTLKQVVSIGSNVVSQFSTMSTPCTMSLSTVNTSLFATTYFWDFGDGFTSTLNNPSHNYSSAGNYTIMLISNPGTSCADTIYNPVTISGNPVPAFSYIQDLCSGTVTFTNNSINATSYQWNFDGANSSNLTNPTFNFNKPGTYTVSLTAQPGFPCATTIVQTIIVNFIGVTADFNYNNPQYTNDVQFINLSQNAIKFEWSFGDGFGATTFEPAHTYAQMGEYTTCLMATNSIGCHDVICKKIKVDADWTLYVPDAFTPNADGLNDLFFAKGTNISKFSMMIFDRWGEKIFSSDDIMSGWDGKYRGKLVAEDIYIWKINFTDIYSKSHDKIGHVTVIR
jgi:gliding motility-associated-like protein